MILLDHDYQRDDSLIQTHLGDRYDRYLGAVVPPVFMNSLHVFPSVEAYYAADRYDEEQYIYGRTANPTVHILEAKIAALEKGNMALCFSSGMAVASTAVLAVCGAGSHIVCIKNAYGPLRSFLEQYCVPRPGMSVTYVDGVTIDEFETAIRENTALIILESPSSIVFSLQDLRAVAELAAARGIRTYIDNTYCSPILQKPLDLGIDIVMHTVSKYIGGHSDLIGGVLVSKDTQLMKMIASQMREWLGGILEPMEGWLALRGIRTLGVRIRRHEQAARAIAGYLEKHPLVKRVFYPGLPSHPQYSLMQSQQTGNSGLLSFELDAPAEKIAAAINEQVLRLFRVGVSWGGFESLITMPFYRHTEEETTWLNASRSLVRIHCGLEGEAYLLEDLESLFRQF